MKKITLVVALLCSISAFSTRYLVQGATGTNTWRAAGAGEVNVTLGTTLKAWYDGQSMAANDEVWLAAGTYAVTASITMKADVSLYGSFAGTETAVSGRSKVSGGNPWEFTNQTILDGNNADTQGLITTISVNPTYLDGLMITKFHKLPGTAITQGVAVSLKKNCTLQNSIVSYNTFVGVSTNGNGCKGVGVDIKGGNLINSYIHNNDCLIGTSTSADFNGAGIALWGAVLGEPVSLVKGCTIESNTSTKSGAGMFLGEDWSTRHSGGDIEDCIFKSNSVLAAATTGTAGGGAIYGYAGSNSGSFTLKNCQFIENSSTGGLGGGGVYLQLSNVPITVEGCSFIGNVANSIANANGDGGGALFCSNGLFAPIKNCIFRDNQITTGSEGSAISCKVPVTLQNCVFANNTSGVANTSTIIFTVAGCKLLNSTIAQNASTGTGKAVDCLSRAVVVTNCVFWGNSNGNFKNAWSTTNTYNAYDTNVGDAATIGIGSINTLTSSNTFVLPTNFKGASADATQKAASAAANWNLKSGCPAINAGTDLTASGVTTDILGNVRPLGVAYDMGAYESIVVSTSQNASSFATNSSITVQNGGTLTVDVSATLNSLTIERGGKVTNNSGQTLTASSLTINSDANGTGTYVDNGTTSISDAVNVNQYLTGLTGSSTRAWWYLTSPVSGATAAVFNVEGGINKMTSYDETVPGYLTQFSSNATALNPGVGYVTYIGGGDATYTFSTNTGVATAKLNTGSISVPVTRTGTTAGKRGFNLIGNPYPSYLDWGQVDTTNVLSTIWYRSYSSAGTSMVFDTYNGKLGIAINNSNNSNTLSQFIPPMQAFWVKVRSEKANVSGLTVNFTNAMRSHQSSSVAGLLRSPKSIDQKVLRLQVSDGINSDQAVIATNANASNGFDDYDSPKLSNDNVAIPEIYTLAGTEQVAINGLNSITTDQELPLGFTTGTSNNFSIQATQVSNFDADTKIILKDNLLNTQQDITDGTPYSFSSDVANTTGRFTVIFKSASIATEIGNNVNVNQGMYVYKNANNQIVINRTKSIEQEATATVCNALGQKLVSVTTTGTSTVIRKSFGSGVYFVTLNIAGEKTTKKVIIN